MSTIENLIFKQLALSLNHENAGDKKVPYLSVAYTAEDAAGSLTEEHIDGYFGKYTYRSWFNINGGTVTPMDWLKRFELNCSEGFKDVPVTMRLKGKKELEFDGCRLYFDRLRFIGGMILPDFHIHLIKHTEQDMIVIRRAEFSEVTLSLGEGVLIERKARKQRELPFGADPKADDQIDGPGSPTPIHGHAAERDETHVWWQHGETQEQGNGKRCDLPAGCVEIDPPAGGKSEREQIEAQLGQMSPEITGDGTGNALPPVDDSEQFAEGVAKALGAHKKRGGAIDGRSERVKHRDRQQADKH